MTIENGSTITLSLSTLQETFQLGHLLGRSLPAGSIVLLQGELGSGKTTLVKAIGQGLGMLDEIISPTFVLVNEYGSGRVPLYHFDLYRLNDSHIKTLTIEQYWDEAEYEPG
ncbi:MAG: tRNA (adenosine(37)-N6)-threonylcarbamoyltransferase complex ATPase subunit type 1 TsaE, partial [Cyanobacteria bacterium J06633_2]